MTNEEINRAVAEKVFGLTGLGYYGPPQDGSEWKHIKSVRHDTAEQANAAYATYWDKQHKESPHGFAGRDEWDAKLCHWKDGWGPVSVDNYATWADDDYSVLERVRETWSEDRRSDFRVELANLWEKRCGSNGVGYSHDEYLPGDYSRCTLAVLEREKGGAGR